MAFLGQFDGQSADSILQMRDLVRPRMDAILINGALDSRKTRSTHVGIASAPGSIGDLLTSVRSKWLKKKSDMLLVKLIA